MDCSICARESEPAIYRDDLVRVEHCPPEPGASTVYLGRILVEPVRHAPGIADLNEAEALAIGRWVRLAGRVLKELGAEHIYSFVLGHQVPHCHFHVIPRYPGTPKEFWGFKVLEWTGAPHGAGPEVAAFCEKIRRALDQS